MASSAALPAVLVMIHDDLNEDKNNSMENYKNGNSNNCGKRKAA
eukprot:CAMPEP_0201887522 /NCGR_PEP_ID=MMETSP0902-20130614/25171_1 /ASSEMBLY_ACC=CAM_ASM_000551 /TAXON_ID=420261 /ORGANISM="Thalassiosira antarctica, Strain CCMP982" /LENGTH=43 /DNA_ID= /DNA_START= /DNA_END= /DNA_ORIENTATION=